MIIVCSPSATTTPVIPGCTQEKCNRCGESIWAAPSTQKQIGVAELICTPCAIAEMQQHECVEVRPVPGGLIEARAFLERN